jgi:Flp pilus assembly protein TadD
MPDDLDEQALSDALAHHRAGRADAAQLACDAVLARNPWHADALHLAGVLAHGRGDAAGAIDRISSAIGVDPARPPFHLDLGTVLLGQGLYAAAEQCFAAAARLDPGLAEAHYNRALSLRRMGRVDAAEASVRRAISIQPRFAPALCVLSALLSARGQCDEATAVAQAALAIDPRDVLAHTALADACRRSGDVAGALAWCDRALAIVPDAADARAMRGLLMLLAGDLDAGWREYEWRWRIPGTADVLRRLPGAMWDGSTLGGRTLLIWCDQGLGDAIQFVRYVSMVAARGGRVVIDCPATLVDLFRTVPGVADLVAAGTTRPPFDLHCPVSSLPAVLGTGADTLGATVPYLSVDAARAAAWADRLGPRDGRLRVGLVWAGSPTNPNDRGRSIALAELLPILRPSSASFVSLQRGPAAGQLRGLPADVTVADVAADLTDMAATAAALSQLDLLVTIDSSVNHLAGAIGVPSWLLVPFAPDWRWGLGGRTTQWYPSMVLFRQARPGDWAAPVQAAARELATVVPADVRRGASRAPTQPG